MGAFGESILKKVSSIAKSISNIFENNQVTVANLITVVLIFGAEWLMEESKIFSCPCTKELAMTYGLSLIFGGAAILWMIGLLVYSQIWRACHGCWYLTFEMKCCYTCYFFIFACVKTMIVPLAWVLAILLDGDYLACMKSTQSCDEESEDYKKWKSQSQICGFYTLCGILLLALVGRCLSRCCNTKSYLLYTLSEQYRKAEEQILFKCLPERSENLAKEVVASFLQKKDLNEEDWSAAANENQNLGAFLSPLHKFVEVRKCAQVPLQVIVPLTERQ